ncbi:MAG TPA: phage GP46 family protein [Polaromonas sp.]|uniref:phage GP46 family protein n=1 Tax=Polaromonas sp. TaxID=1869339 RepID=UPI002D60F87E|nr:phage GP46 family protein [Polaromonas sp.]HYW57670.1 phage GP46 family protein [Polaromonas sp.]
MDVKLLFGCDAEVCADVGVACGDLMMGNDLSTAIMISLFTDRRADEDDVIPDGTDPRGWWADALDGERIGSRLWLLERSRSLPEVFARAKEYAEEALQWLLDDGVAAKVAVTAEGVRGTDCINVLSLQIDITKPDGKSLAWKYRYAWDLRQVQACEDFEIA